MSKIGYVYIVKSHELHKIGRAWNLEKRLLQLRTAAPFLEYIHSIETSIPQKLEHWLHLHFNRKRVIGEWFDLSADDLTFIKTVDAAGTQLEGVRFALSYEENMRWGRRASRELGRVGAELDGFLNVLAHLPKDDPA